MTTSSLESIRQLEPGAFSVEPVGTSLDHWLERRPDIEACLRIAVAVTDELDRLHSQTGVHGDFKPANVWLYESEPRIRFTGASTRSGRPLGPSTELELLPSSLPYVAPERTGRVGRPIDARTDLYAWGSVLYEMFSGQTPFQAPDPIAWIHCQVAMRPLPLERRAAGMPAPLAGIVMKLLEKAPEDRYQTALGLGSDLRRCLAAWQATGTVGHFSLGAEDLRQYGLGPVALYGRASEMQALGEALERVIVDDKPEVLLLSGYSGIGKSSLVQEFRRTAARGQTLFVEGKVDVQNRDVPFATLAQAFHELTRWLLAQTPSELERWASELDRALRPNGALVARLLPDIELVIGRQAEVPPLPPDEARNRIREVFRRFLRVFASSEHPLVLFLDDLQWLDASSQELLEHLLIDPELRGLLLLGAFRSNEVDAEHALWSLAKTVRRAGVSVQELSISPLPANDVEKLVAQLVEAPLEAARPLAALVAQKAGGNPFFVRQFVASLADERLLRFDPSTRRWRWDAAGIAAKGYTENLADLVIERLTRLPPSTQRVLGHLSCLGEGGDAPLLATLEGVSVDELPALLDGAVGANIVRYASGRYTFLHDRLKEAAYALIGEAERTATHLAIGRALLAQTPRERLAQSLFDILAQCNRGIALVRTPAERLELAQLNLAAAHRSQATGAHGAAVGYLEFADQLLPEERWREQHELTFAVGLTRAACQWVLGERAKVEHALAELAARARDPIEQAAVLAVRLPLEITLGRFDGAATAGLEYLAGVGVRLSLRPSRAEVARQYERLKRAIAGRPIHELLELPTLASEIDLATLDVCNSIVVPAYFIDRNLHALIILFMATLSVERGNSDFASNAYAMLSLVLGPLFGEPASGLEFGRLGVALVDEKGLSRFRSHVYLAYGGIVVPRSSHIHESHDWLARAADSAERSGDVVYTIQPLSYRVSSLLACGEPLSEVKRQAEAALRRARSAEYSFMMGTISVQLALARMLSGATPSFGSLNDSHSDIDEPRYESKVLPAPEAFYYWVRKLQARFYAQDFAEAAVAARKAHTLVSAGRMFVEETQLWFFGALAEAALCSESEGSGGPQLEAMLAYEAEIAAWVEHAPENFSNKLSLVRAERARLEGRSLEAGALYEQAIRLAKEHRFVHEEALACELAARFYSARGFETAAGAYAGAARAAYVKWGALGKVRELDERAASGGQGGSWPAPVSLEVRLETLDFATVVQALLAVSSELEVDALLHGLMKSSLQHAVADRGVLVLLGAEPRVRAVARASDGALQIALQDRAPSSEDLPASVLHFVLRTHEKVLINDGTPPQTFASDRYFTGRTLRSLLCLPIVVRGRAVGALYLENSLTSRSFAASGLWLLDLLSAQAAISLENARLYASIRQAKAYMSHAESVGRTGSFSWKPSTGEHFWSDELYRIFEIEGEVSLDRQRERIHPDDRALFERALLAPMLVGEGPLEIRLVMPDGSLKQLSVVATLLPTEAGGAPEYVGTVRDVTEAKRTEEALQRSRAALTDMTRIASLGEMAAAIAHEVNQPLAAIRLNSSACVRWLAEKQLNIEEARAAALRSARDAERAAAVIQRLRALFGKTGGPRELLDLNEAITEVVALVRSQLRASAATLQLELAPELPRPKADRVQLQQVLMNLLLNAADAMEGVDERPRRILVRSLATAEALEVEVRDNGTGVPKDVIDRVFDPFYTTKPRGMGIGLSVSRTIVESHGGVLAVRANADGPGATFTFSLPVGAGS
jgi:predicted ATPase/signal transduction histidine kinase